MADRLELGIFTHRTVTHTVAVIALTAVVAVVWCGAATALSWGNIDQDALSIQQQQLNVLAGGQPRTYTYFEDATRMITNPSRGPSLQNIDAADGDVPALRDSRALPDVARTMQRVIIRLDAYRNTDTLPQSAKDNLQAMFDNALARRVKLIIHCAYNYSNSGLDTSQTRVVGHIQQLAAVLNANAHLIVAAEMGFIGKWGEWHSSSGPDGVIPNMETTGVNSHDGLMGGIPTIGKIDVLATPKAATRAIWDAVLANWTAIRNINNRYPQYREHYLGSSAISTADAFGMTPHSRVGVEDNGMFNSLGHFGTYGWSSGNITTLKNLVALNKHKLVYFGEADYHHLPAADGGTGITNYGSTNYGSVPAGSFTYVDTADTVMAQLGVLAMNWPYASDGPLPLVNQRWNATGLANTLLRKMGYRYWLESATIDSSVRVGGTLHVKMRVRNAGYTPVKDLHELVLVLTPTGGGTPIRVPVGRSRANNTDPRLWVPEAPTDVSADVQLPSTVASGNYTLGFELVDSAQQLANITEYKIEFANTAASLPVGGTRTHALGHTVTVGPQYRGSDGAALAVAGTSINIPLPAATAAGDHVNFVLQQDNNVSPPAVVPTGTVQLGPAGGVVVNGRRFQAYRLEIVAENATPGAGQRRLSQLTLINGKYHLSVTGLNSGNHSGRSHGWWNTSGVHLAQAAWTRTDGLSANVQAGPLTPTIDGTRIGVLGAIPNLDTFTAPAGYTLDGVSVPPSGQPGRSVLVAQLTSTPNAGAAVPVMTITGAGQQGNDTGVGLMYAMAPPAS